MTLRNTSLFILLYTSSQPIAKLHHRLGTSWSCAGRQWVNEARSKRCDKFTFVIRNKRPNTPGGLIYSPFHIPTTARENVARFRPNLETLSRSNRNATKLREWSLVSSHRSTVRFDLSTLTSMELPYGKHVRCFHLRKDQNEEKTAKDNRLEYWPCRYFTPLSKVSVDRFMKNWKLLGRSFTRGLVQSEMLSRIIFKYKKYPAITTNP